MRLKFPRLSRPRRSRIREDAHTLRAPIAAEPAVVNPRGYQETQPPPDAVAKDRALEENCALLQRARADDPDACRDDTPSLTRSTPSRKRP